MEKYAILSVDWDYFFPRIDMFDWGHRDASLLFAETIWMMRAMNFINYESLGYFKEEKRLIHYLQPSLRGVYDAERFWKKVCPRYPSQLFICESHADLYKVAKILPSCELWNFDAHHDSGYENFETVECDNWVNFLMREGCLTSYNLVYPQYRKEFPESAEMKVETNFYYRIPLQLPHFRYVFICRSSSWTPSWTDACWLDLIYYWRRQPDLWSRKTVVPYVMERRKFDFSEAYRNAQVFEEYRKKIAKENKKVLETEK